MARRPPPREHPPVAGPVTWRRTNQTRWVMVDANHRSVLAISFPSGTLEATMVKQQQWVQTAIERAWTIEENIRQTAALYGGAA